MRKQILQGAGVLLIALTVWTAIFVGWTLWQGTGLPVEAGAGGESEGRLVTVREVNTTTRLQLESGEQIQLAAIQAPGEGEPYAEEGRQAARALVQGKQVRMVGDPSAAYLYLPTGSLLQQLLIEGGYARLASDPPDDEVVAELRQVEAEARAQNLGLWGGIPVASFPTAGPTPAPISCEPSLVAGDDTLGPNETADHVGEIAPVVFLPFRAIRRGGTVTLMSGLSEKEFAVVIPPKFANQDKELEAKYLNRCVVVTGKIEQRGSEGPRIELRSLDHILILR